MDGPSAGTWTDLGDGIRVRQSRVYWMNSVLLLDAEHTVLVDPGVLPSELDDLEAATGAPTRLTLVFTHGDWDHVLGRPWWPKAQTVAHDRFAEDIHKDPEAIARLAAKAVLEAGEQWDRGFAPFHPDDPVSGLHFARLGRWRLVYRDAPGHSPSMLSIHLPEHHTLIAADLLSDIEIPMLKQPSETYRRTLLELLPLAEHGAIQTLIPGHGSIARGAETVLARLRRDLDYLEQLERRVRAAHGRGLSEPETTRELDEMEYTGKHAAYTMVDDHHRNVGLVYRGLMAGGQARRER
jgi:hydroxyacylglutathione hydrolase